VGTRALSDALEDTLAGRPALDILDAPGRRAAVLLLLFDRDDEAHMLLTKRSDELPSHPGQVSLPGGVRDPADPSLAATALREAEEEVGVDPEGVRLLGRLDDVNTIASGFLVRPFVAEATTAVRPVPRQAEVARVLEVPVGQILRIDAGLPADAGIRTLRYPLAGEDVWGATARILRTFCGVARDALGR
jgi:8-oxo-dGTP pyrophosphatase MutT (NUDIX family)